MSRRIARLPRATPGLALLALLSLPAGAAAQNAELVKDITPPTPIASPGDLQATDFLAAGNKLFFVAGGAVWVTDGTSAGTELLGDGCGGACDSPQLLASAKGLAFWIASGDATRLIRSDGTRAGTYPLLGPTGDLSTQTGSIDVNGPSFAILGDTLYFAGCQGADSFSCDGEESELWRTDGTAAGTRKVRSDGTRDFIDELNVWKGRLYYFSFGGSAPALWTSNGTAAGTRKVADLAFGPENGPRRLTALADRLVLIAGGVDGKGDELWGSDGTAAGTGPITDFAAPTPFDLLPGHSEPALRALGGRAYFLADDVIHGAEIWTSDGTAAGTRRVTEFGFHAPFPSGELRAGLLGTRLVFVATDGLSPEKLWTTDGTPESTAALSDELPAFGTDLVPLDSRLVFVTNGADGSGSEVWATDGTAAGTKQLADICPGLCGGAASAPRLLAGGVVLVGRDGDGKSDLWRTDGTAAGTRRLTRLGTVDVETPLASFGGRLFFDAVGAHGRSLFESDASPSGARLVAESWDGPGTTVVAPTEIGGRLVFTTCSFQTGWSAWSSDGTAAGTLPFASGTNGYCPSITPIGTAGGHLFFSASDGFWATDGTAAGTVSLPLFDVFSFLAGSVVSFGNRLFYGLASFSPTPPAIWASDGTVAGTRKAFDLPAGIAQLGHAGTGADKLFVDGVSSDGETGAIWATDGTAAGLVKIADLKVDAPFYRAVGSRVFFFHADPVTGREEVWVTDGTPLGTFRAATLPIGDGIGDLEAVDAVAYGGALLFFVRNYDSAALWRSDGTAAGTVELHPFASDAPNEPASLTVAGGLLYFTADDGDHGVELWQTDGTAAGTVLARDVLPGPASSQPSHLTAFGGRLYFTADDGVHGVELWQSDGTADGTHLAQDVAPGVPGSDPEQLTVAGDHLFFNADDGLHGHELWALPLPGTAGCEPSPAHLCLAGNRFRVEADWRDFQGNTGTGTAVAMTPDTGYFWFFNPANVEVVTKVLDGRGVNQAFWVFYGALSSVEYTLTVTDTQTGLTRRYENPAGELASVGDTRGFGPLGAFDTQKEAEPPRAARALTLVAARTDPRAATGTCAAGPGRLCLNGGRFSVTARWKDFQGHTGDGAAVPLTGDTGYFWFFDPANVEVVTKVIDGRPVNDKFWLFYGALSSVEYTLTVTDTQTGAVKMYKNASGNLASVADTGAF